MPVLVHLTDERLAAHIKRTGIKPRKYSSGIYCMPVLQNFYISHQWLRELKRWKAKTLVGVYFKMDSKTKVYAGKYSDPHKNITLGEAIKEIMSLEDPQGYELIIDRKIEAKEIKKIVMLPQNIGWRYQPGSHNKKPCGCEFCTRGKVKASRVRQKYDQNNRPALSYEVILPALQKEQNEYAVEDLLNDVARKKRRGDPSRLLFLLERKSDYINQAFALALTSFRHNNTKKILLMLLENSDPQTKEYSVESLLTLYGDSILPELLPMQNSTIKKAVDDWVSNKNK